ncbi:MAG: MATE family efflux transporter [Bacillota bacterium]|nr:MATE family efflux transporter [Bacillota bacterium]
MEIKLSDHFTYKRLYRFVLPSILMMVVTSIYSVIDGFFVSNFVGKTAFASINLIWPIIMILGGAGFMFGTGGTALVSRILGEKDRERANRVFSMVVVSALIIGIILSVVGFLLMEPLARLLGASEAMMDDCLTYGRIVVCFTPLYMLQNIFQSFLVAAEKPRLGLYVTLIAGCSNAILDALFMVGFSWGVAGAAVATGIGQALGGLIPLIYFLRPNNSLLRLGSFHFDFRSLFAAMVNGSSEFFTNVSSSIVSIFYNLQLMSFIGEDGVSAYGVLMYVQFIFLAIEIGYSIGVAPLIAYNYGAKRDDELKSLFRKSLVTIVCLGLILSTLAEALAIPLSMMFVGYDEGLYNLTVYAFRIFSLSFLFSGFGIFSSSFFTALNDGLTSALISIFRCLLFQSAFVFLLPALLGVDGIWWATFAAEGASFIVAIAFFVGMRKRYRYA